MIRLLKEPQDTPTLKTFILLMINFTFLKCAYFNSKLINPLYPVTV